MANTNIKEILTKAGTTAAFAVAMTAALAIPANASENTDTTGTAAPLDAAPTAAPASEPAPVQRSSDAQEVAQHNTQVAEANTQAVETNESTSSANTDTNTANESAAAANEEKVEKNESTAAANEEKVEKNESVAAENRDLVEDVNEEITNGNQEVVDSNEDIHEKNQEAIEGNENLTTELPNAPEAPDAPGEPDLDEPAFEGEEPADPELDETPELPEDVETPDLDETDPDKYNENVDDYNEQVGDYNTEADEYNENVGDYNGKTDNYNTEAGDYNTETDNYNTQVGDYNKEAGDYNTEADNYNTQVDEYNTQVDVYNEAVDKINKELADQYEEAKKDYDEAEEGHKQDVEDYEADKAAHEAKKAAFAAYQEAIADMQAAYEALGEDPTEEAVEDYKAAIETVKTEYAEAHDDEGYAQGLADYADNLEEKRLFALNKQEYDEKVKQDKTQQEIYDEVEEYNNGITEKNEDVAEANEALKNDLHADVADNLEAAASSNAEVNENFKKDNENGAEILAILGTAEDLAGQVEKLKAEGEALKNEDVSGYDLGSQAYADYLARVKAHNTAVDAVNEKLAEYNAAAETYNAYVDDYNAANKPADPTTTTEGGTQEEEGHVTDWGNINIDDYTLGHIDVKYQAAASKDKTVDADGNETYTETVTQYTVTGVYTSEDSYKNGGGFGLTFDNDGDGKQKPDTQVLYVNSSYSEFSHMEDKWGAQHNEIADLDPDSGTVSFYVTLKDAEGKIHGIDVNLNGNSVYAKGSYYKASDNDYLSKFRYMDENGNPIKDEDGNEIGLPTVIIGGEEYYDISDQSVFLISALTCDGMGEEKGMRGTPTGWLNPDGLDLILNLQTMIEIHKADNARKITYQGYQLGMLAAAEAPGNGPGDFEGTDPGDISLLEGPGDFEGTDPGEFDKEKPTQIVLEKLNKIENGKLYQVNELTALENLNELETLDPISPLTGTLEYKMLLDIPDEPPADEPVWFNDDVPVEEVRWFDLGDGLAILPDEAVPLAKAPKTGDNTALFGLMSLFSLSGLYLTGKKRKNRE